MITKVCNGYVQYINLITQSVRVSVFSLRHREAWAWIWVESLQVRTWIPGSVPAPPLRWNPDSVFLAMGPDSAEANDLPLSQSLQSQYDRLRRIVQGNLLCLHFPISKWNVTGEKIKKYFGILAAFVACLLHKCCPSYLQSSRFSTQTRKQSCSYFKRNHFLIKLESNIE